MWDAEVTNLLATLNSGFPNVANMDAPQAPAAIAARRAPVSNLDDVASVEDIEIPSVGGRIPARVYTHTDRATFPAR